MSRVIRVDGEVYAHLQRARGLLAEATGTTPAMNRVVAFLLALRAP